MTNDSYFCINISFKAQRNLYQLFGYDDNDKINDEDLVQHLKSNLKKHGELNNGMQGAVEEKPKSEDDKNVKDLFHIYDVARAETLRLMHSAVSRFKLTERYKAWVASK